MAWPRGKSRSEEDRRKISETLRGRIPWNKGKLQSEETRRKRSLAMKGRHHSEETKRKISEAKKGHVVSEKTNKKIVAALSKRPTSYERKFIDLAEEQDFPFKYVGDGSLIVGKSNPDFVDTLRLDPPLIVETYDRYWHPGNYEDVRHKKLCVPRRNVLFLSGDDLCREDWKKHCASKVRWFLLARMGVDFVCRHQID